MDWNTVRRLFGETMREVGILVVVFAPLDAAFFEGPVRFELLAAAVLASFALILVGIVLEAEEK